MIKINDTFELDYDGQWLLYEWYDGKKKVGKGYVTDRKRKGPSYYSDLNNACRSILDRSAGIACKAGEDIINALKQAERDILGELGARDYRDMWG